MIHLINHYHNYIVFHFLYLYYYLINEQSNKNIHEILNKNEEYVFDKNLIATLYHDINGNVYLSVDDIFAKGKNKNNDIEI